MQLNFIKLIITVFYFIILFNNNIQSQQETFQWYDVQPCEIVPEEYKNFDAVIVDYKRIIDLPADHETHLALDFDYYYIDPSIIFRYHYETVYTRIKILTGNGLKNYAYVYTPIIDESNLVYINARTIKQTGEIIEMADEDIIKTKFETDDKYDWRIGQWRFAVPGVEIGDEIEIAIKYSVFHKKVYEDVFLNSYLPIISAEMEINMPASSFLYFKTYNDFPQPEINIDSTDLHARFSLKQLVSIADQPKASIYNELPYFSILIQNSKRWYIKDGQTDFGAIYDIFEKNYEQGNHYVNSQNYLHNFLKKQTKNMKGNTAIQKFDTIYNYYKNNLEIRRLEESEKQYHPGYYLKNGFIDLQNLKYLYKKTLDFLEIDYYIAIARQKSLGPIDMSFIRSNELTHIFMIILDDVGNYQIIYPHSRYQKFEIGEYPPELSGAEAILIMKNKESIDLKMLNLPEGSSGINFKKVDSKVIYDTNSEMMSLHNRFTLSGAISTNYRHNNVKLVSDTAYLRKYIEKSQLYDSLYNFDSVYIECQKDEAPYMCRQSIKYNTKANLVDLGDHEFAITLNKWCYQITPLPCSNKKRTLNYEIDFPFSNSVNIYMVFANQIEILNQEDIDLHIENEFGKFQSSANQVNDKAILLKIEYKINKSFLEKENIGYLLEINDTFDKLKNSTLLIKCI